MQLFLWTKKLCCKISEYGNRQCFSLAILRIVSALDYIISAKSWDIWECDSL